MDKDTSYITPETNVIPQFAALPRTLLEFAPKLGISIEAVLAYTLMRSRASLSARNGRTNWDRTVYIYYPRTTMCRHLRVSKGTAQKAYNQLLEAQLIKEIPSYNHSIPKIYVSRWVDPDPHTPIGDFVKQLPLLTSYVALQKPESYLRYPLPACCDPAFLSLRLRSRLLYVLLLDKLNGALHQGLCDHKGHYICHIDAARAKTLLQCSSNSALSNAYAQLTASGYVDKNKVSFASVEYCRLRPCWRNPPPPFA